MMTKELFTKYLNGNCSPEEVIYVEESLKDPMYINNLMPQDDWDNIVLDTNSVKSEILLSQIYERIRNKKKRKLTHIIRVTGIAASLFILFSLGLIIKKYSQHSESLKIVSIEQKDLIIANLVQINSSNQNIELICSDGSIITLFPNSEIRYAENFQSLPERKIYLKGKAKFKVAKDKEKPFHVISKGFITTALGTTFIVSESAKSHTKIELLEGKIEINSKKSDNVKPIQKLITHSGSIILANINARIINEVKPINQNNSRESSYLEQENNIVIKNLAIDDIFQILEQNHSIKISFDSNKTKNKYFSGTFVNDNTTYQKIINEINFLHKLTISYTK